VRTSGSKPVHPNSAAARKWGRQGWGWDTERNWDEPLNSRAETERWKPKPSDLSAAADTPELEKLVSEQLSDDKRKYDPRTGTWFDQRPQRLGEHVLSLDAFESHDGLTPADSDERNGAGAKYGVPRGNVPVDIGGVRSAPASFDCEARNVEVVHRKLSNVWRRLRLEAEEELLDALFADEQLESRVSGRHSARTNLRELLVKRWWEKYALHPDLTEEGRTALVVSTVKRVCSAFGQLEIVERHENGETQRALAAEYGMSQSAISRLCLPLEIPEPGGVKLSPKMAEAILREVRGNREVLERIERRLDGQESLRELEAYLAGAAEAREAQETA
jgi:hypothetical protein